MTGGPCSNEGHAVAVSLPLADPLGSLPGEADGLPAEGQEQQGRAAGWEPGRGCPRFSQLVTPALPPADRVLQPRAVPAAAEQHPPLRLRDLRLPPALRRHREYGSPTAATYPLPPCHPAEVQPLSCPTMSTHSPTPFLALSLPLPGSQWGVSDPQAGVSRFEDVATMMQML